MCDKGECSNEGGRNEVETTNNKKDVNIFQKLEVSAEGVKAWIEETTCNLKLKNKAEALSLTNHQGINLLIYCCSYGDEHAVEEVLKQTASIAGSDNRNVEINHRSLLNHKDNTNLTALHYASKLGDEEIVELLLRYGAELNTTNDDFEAYLSSIPLYISGGRTPLHFAAEGKYVNICRLLLRHFQIHIPSSSISQIQNSEIFEPLPRCRNAIFNDDNDNNIDRSNYNADDGEGGEEGGEEDPREVEDNDGAKPWFLALMAGDIQLAKWLLPPSYFQLHSNDKLSPNYTLNNDMSSISGRDYNRSNDNNSDSNNNDNDNDDDDNNNYDNINIYSISEKERLALKRKHFIRMRNRFHILQKLKEKSLERSVNDISRYYSPQNTATYHLSTSHFDERYLQFEKSLFHSTSCDNKNEDPPSSLSSFFTSLKFPRLSNDNQKEEAVNSDDDNDNENTANFEGRRDEVGAFVFPLFNEKFCDELLEELEKIEMSNFPLRRPNSMNNYGCILNDLGFSDLATEIMDRVVKNVAKVLYRSQHEEIESLDHHHSFIVKYKIGEDLNLKKHFDDSEFTLNVCLGKQFTGGHLFFPPRCDLHHIFGTAELVHSKGFGILHKGRVLHGASSLLSGERQNLILWCKSSRKRCISPPSSTPIM